MVDDTYLDDFLMSKLPPTQVLKQKDGFNEYKRKETQSPSVLLDQLLASQGPLVIEAAENADKSRGLANVNDVKARFAQIRQSMEKPVEDQNLLDLTDSISNLHASGNLPQGS